MIRAAAFAMSLWAMPVFAQTPAPSSTQAPAEAAEQAAARLEVAAMSLNAADGARDRVAALTEVVAAYEDG